MDASTVESTTSLLIASIGIVGFIAMVLIGDVLVKLLDEKEQLRKR